MNIFQLHLGKLPQPQPCIPKPWQTKQCRTALCSPFPDFPAGTGFSLIPWFSFGKSAFFPDRNQPHTAGRGRVTTPCPATSHTCRKFLLQFLSRANRKENNLKLILFVLAIMWPLIQDLWNCCLRELHSAPPRAVGLDKLGLQITEGNKRYLRRLKNWSYPCPEWALDLLCPEPQPSPAPPSGSWEGKIPNVEM